MAETIQSLHGLMAEFKSSSELFTAIAKSRQAGYQRLDAFSPVPVEGLSEALGQRRSRLSMMVFCGGITGMVTGFALQYWVSVHAYPLNLGGKPLNSWPAFMPVIFELTVLFSALTAVIGMFALNGLPQPYHPVFNVKRFCESANVDRYFFLIESVDPKFQLDSTRSFLKTLGSEGVYEVQE